MSFNRWVMAAGSVFLAAVFLQGAGCGKGDEESGGKAVEEKPEGAGDKASGVQATDTHRTRGVVRAVDESDGILFIEHEDIPGVMPSMTMPFQLGETGSVADYPPGTAVEVGFRMDGNGVQIDEIGPIDGETLNLPTPKPVGGKSNVPRVKPGDAVPEFQLVGEDGNPLTLEDFSGRSWLVTFIFVRCPVPDFCPLLTSKFSAIQSAVQSDPTLAGKVSLLSVSFDEADTPEVLAQYGRAHGANPQIWRFATGTPNEIDKLTRTFSVRIEKNGATIDHGLATALIDPDGTVVEIWRGNAWDIDEVVEALRQSLAAPGAQKSSARQNESNQIATTNPTKPNKTP